MSSGEALLFFIIGLLLLGLGIAMLSRHLRRQRGKSAVDYYHFREGLYIYLGAVAFGSLLAMGGGVFYFAPHAPGWVLVAVGVIFGVECVGCILFMRSSRNAWQERLKSERLEREHQQVLHKD